MIKELKIIFIDDIICYKRHPSQNNSNKYRTSKIDNNHLPVISVAPVALPGFI